MQYAKCTLDDKVWEADQFSKLESNQLEQKRKNLVCSQCGEFAWFRKESRHGHPAHFCAHHDDNCDLKVEYVTSDDALLASETQDELSSGDTIIVRLDKENGGELNVNPSPSKPTNLSSDGGTAYITKGSNRESSQQFTLRRILHRLVQSKDFRNSDKKIVFYKNNDEIMLQGSINTIVTSFDNISIQTHNEKVMFYWGPIASAKKTPDNKIWLNSSSAYKSASISIFEDIADEFLELFKIEDLEDLAGAYVLVAGRCYFSGKEQKPIIWCGTPNYIFVRKYKEKNL